jgi:glycosyltransferase involved in cell wall biosynthesis
MIKVVFLIRSLDYGGAERQLALLAKTLDKDTFEVTILTYYGGGGLERELEGSGVCLISLRKRGRWDLLGFSRRLVRQLRRLRPDVIHGYLDTANLLSLWGKALSPRAGVVWAVGASEIDFSHYDWTWHLGFFLERRLARLPDRIIVNSEAGHAYLSRCGFPASKLTVIQNGIDTERFKPDAEARSRVRQEWGVADGETLIGLVGRLDPIKDHRNFLRAASILCRQRDDVRFVCVGDGEAGYARELHAAAESLSLRGKLRWAGARADVSALYNALDVHVSSSESEGFSNTIGEAMACGVPCVVTDVGDSALIVGETGVVVAPGDAEALAHGLLACLSQDRQTLGAQARARIEAKWGAGRLAQQTAKALLSTLERN